MIDTPLMNEINEAAAQGKTSLHEEDRLRYEMAEALSYALKITEGIDYTLNTYRIAYRVLTALNQKGYTIAPIAQPVSEFEVSSGCVFNDLKTCPPDGRCVNANPASDEKLREAVATMDRFVDSEERRWGMAEVNAFNAIESAIAEREALMSARQWQPIETAPDNITVLLYCPNIHATNPERVEVGVFRRYRVDKDGKPVQGTFGEHAWATHWMPLPTPPANGGE